MSRIVTTKLGRFRGVTDGAKNWWLFECPNCKTWLTLNERQMNGEVSVYCDVPVPSYYGMTPDDKKLCGYHQTHEYAKELVVTIQVRTFMGQEPFEEDRPTEGASHD